MQPHQKMPSSVHLKQSIYFEEHSLPMTLSFSARGFNRYKSFSIPTLSKKNKGKCHQCHFFSQTVQTGRHFNGSQNSNSVFNHYFVK
jgi:hypothetical protein